MTLLRLATAGSVDDGKSTLIGRLLHDSKAILADQYADLNGRDGEMDLSRLTDGLKAEREQGITIDVAYRYFATPTRDFILADTPGHVQYTRNMVTGASTADVAIVLVDARHGVVEQTRRHAFIASLLGIPHLVVAINKMDLVAYSEERFDEIVRDFSVFRKHLTSRDIAYIPISALEGDNVVDRSEQHVVVRRRAAAAPSGGDRPRRRPQHGGLALPGAARDPQRGQRLPRLRRPGRLRRRAARRSREGAAVRGRVHGRVDRHARPARWSRPSRPRA